MKDFLYLQYVVIRPIGVAPDDKDFDRKAECLMTAIMDDERRANILADEKVSFGNTGYLTHDQELSTNINNIYCLEDLPWERRK